MFTRTELKKLEDLIIQGAEYELLPYFQHVGVEHKDDGSLLTIVDVAMQHCIQYLLAQQWPGISLLGEEMSVVQQQALLEQPDRALWIVDPLDGTSNYASGIPFFASSVALLHAGRVIAGVVYDPIRCESFSVLQGEGAWLNGEPLQLANEPTPLKDAVAMVDLKRLPVGLIQAIAQQAPYHSQRSFGSVALDWCWMAAGRAQVYLHGGQKLWDYAAGRLFFQEAGGYGDVYTDYQGTVETGLTLQPRIGIAASSDLLFQEWQQWLKNHA